MNGDQIFSAMLVAIHSAQKTIAFKIYTCRSASIDGRFADALFVSAIQSRRVAKKRIISRVACGPWWSV